MRVGGVESKSTERCQTVRSEDALDDDARVDDQEAQRPTRDKQIARTTLGIGLPSAMRSQPFGPRQFLVLE